MSYNKRTWANGDLITKERMNNIEDGIYDAHDKINAINNKVEENTTDTNTARQDISDIKLQIGTEELTTTSKKIKGAINDLSSQIKERATKQEVDIERKRIDSFTSLAEGSTTADAELTDIRIGYDGTVYQSAGEAVRAYSDVINQLPFHKLVRNNKIKAVKSAKILGANYGDKLYFSKIYFLFFTNNFINDCPTPPKPIIPISILHPKLYIKGIYL